MNDDNRILYWLTALILFLMPLGIIEISKMQSNVLIPLTVLIALYKLYKKEFKISFYEKYAIFFVIAILISLYFSNYDPVKGYKNLRGDLKWIFLPTLLGQLEIKKSHYKYTIISFLIGSLLIFKKGINEIFSWVGKTPENIKNILDLDVYKNGIIGGYRLSRIFNTLTVTALILGVMVFIFYYLVRDQEIKKRYKIIFVILALFTIFLFMTTKSVGMYVAMFGTVIMMLLINIKKENIKKITISLILVIVFSTLMLKTPYFSRVKIKMKTGDPARIEIYKGTLPMIKDNLLNGVGYDLYEYGISYFEKTPNY
ncbi:MAG: O-antigen ligase family protein, partial [Cetobacterium sp.]